MDEQGIRFVNLGGLAAHSNAWDPISEETVLDALELILNPLNYPLLLMCNLGRHRTGKYIISFS
jgi:tyrosine-protein phosphatase OCA1